MIKKIQKYLLLHHPLIWNIRIIPITLILAGIHIIFFYMGYDTTNTSFYTRYYYSITNDLGLLYFISILVGILLLIGWLVFYNRNNGFKYFYPRKTGRLYLEWMMIFIITTGMALLPVTLTQGYMKKWQAVASLNEAQKAIDLLDKVNLLIPDNVDNYQYNYDHHQPVPFPQSMKYKADTLSSRLYSLQYNRDNHLMETTGYIGASLLFYHDHYSCYYYDDTNCWDTEVAKQLKQQELVKNWLRNGEKDSIYAILSGFDMLRKTHNLQSNISEEFLWITLFCLCASVWISCFIYSFRITKGKSWLISLIATGILIFFTILLAVSLGKWIDYRSELIALLVCLMWIALFIVILAKIADKTRNKGNKGWSEIYMNLFIWMIPCVIPLIYFSYLLCLELSDKPYHNTGNDVIRMFWVNIPVCIPAMWFVSALVRKWKSIGEQ